MPTGPEEFLESPGVSGLWPCVWIDLKKGLVPHSSFWWGAWQIQRTSLARTSHTYCSGWHGSARVYLWFVVKATWRRCRRSPAFALRSRDWHSSRTSGSRSPGSKPPQWGLVYRMAHCAPFYRVMPTGFETSLELLGVSEQQPCTWTHI